jgi:hypothetical protein
MCNDVPLRHPVSNLKVTPKVRLTREEGLKNLVMQAFGKQQLCEAALSKMVASEIQHRMPGRESFKMEWEYDPHKELPETLRVSMTVGDGSTTWWNAVSYEMG